MLIIKAIKYTKLWTNIKEDRQGSYSVEMFYKEEFLKNRQCLELQKCLRKNAIEYILNRRL